MPEAIRQAAATFPLGTGTGADNIAPRAFTRLSDQALSALACLFIAFESAGHWTSALNLVLIVLLAKADGGFRPIGLFPTIIRVWMRTRIVVAKAWEAANAMPALYGGKGKGAQRAAWQAAFAAEAAALLRVDHAQALLDLVKAFEAIPHRLIVKAAIKKKYNLVVLRLSIAAYRLSRSIGIDGIYSRLITATRGITAGSVFATAELRVLLQGVVEAVQIHIGASLDIKLYVDDLTLSVTGLPGKVVKQLAEAVDFVVRAFQEDLLLEVSAKKSVILVGRPSVAAAVVRKLISRKATATKHAKMLGSGTAGGRRRSTHTITHRLHTFSKTVHRLHRLRKSGADVRKMVRTAGVPAISY